MPPTANKEVQSTTSGTARLSNFVKVEWAIAIVLTLLALALHGTFLTHAGALWRDEVNSVNVAAMPSLSDALDHDSFPVVWVTVLRTWIKMGFGSDGALRLLGFGIGVAALASLWFSARRMKFSTPLVSLLLLGFSSTIIRWGDSIRPWGFGIFLNLLTLVLVWNVLRKPSVRNIVLATIAAVCSVNCIYYNAVLLFAICTGGTAVALSHRDWKKAGIVIGIGAVSAMSLLFYVKRIQASLQDYMIMQKADFGFAKFIGKLAEALAPQGELGQLGVWLWAILAIAALGVAICAQLRPQTLNVSGEQNDLLLFTLVALIVGAIGYYAFLDHMKLSTQAWYYAALMGFAAVAIEAMLSVLANTNGGRIVRALLVVATGLIVFLPVKKSLQYRMTSIDLVTSRLKELAGKDDLILIDPWYAGITFDRYYKGETPWMTVPPIDDHKLHRLDLIRKYMMTQDQREPMAPVLRKLDETLQAGRRVWLVGGLNFLQAGETPMILPPAPQSEWGWEDSAYYSQWSSIAGYFVQTHANRPELVPIPELPSVLEYEQVPLLVVGSSGPR